MSVSSEDEVADFVRGAREEKRKLEIVAGGTKRTYGRPMEPLGILDMSALTGIRSYEPEELILTAAPSTSLAEIVATLTAKGQRLGFDPADWAGLLGAEGRATLGGALCADASGPGAVRFGRARDSLLGIRAVNGLGEVFKAGGKVVKNVTGFDIPKLVCGAFGTLCVLTEVTFRVFPKPAAAATFAVCDVAPEEGLAMLRRIWSGSLEPTGLAYVSGNAKFSALGETGRGAALIRIEGAAQPFKEKLDSLRESIGRRDAAGIEDGDALFAAIGAGAVFTDTVLDVWRVALPPSEAAPVAQAMAAPLWLADWAGGMLWLGLQPDDDFTVERLRSLAANARGHARLLRASAGTRGRIGVFPPLEPAHAALTRAVKAAFDPLGLFNPGRMYEDF